MHSIPASNAWFLYIIENRLGQLYTGITTDVARRFSEHASGGARCAKALKGKGPLRLRSCVRLKCRIDALRLEHYIKRQKAGNKLTVLSLGHADDLDIHWQCISVEGMDENLQQS